MAVKLVRQWSHWWRTSETVLARWLRAAHSALLGEMPILAAGTALFAILAVVPMLAAAVALYGLAADPWEIHGELKSLTHVLPVEVVNFIGDQLERQATRSHGELGLQLMVSIGLALFIIAMGYWFAAYSWRRRTDPEDPITVGPAGLHDRALSDRPIAWSDIRNLRVWHSGRGGPVVVFDVAGGADERAGIHERARRASVVNRPFGYTHHVHHMGTDASVDRLVEAIRPYADVKRD